MVRIIRHWNQSKEIVMRKFSILCGFFLCDPLCPIKHKLKWFRQWNALCQNKINFVTVQEDSKCILKTHNSHHPFLFAVDDCLSSLRWLYFLHVMKVKCLLDVICFLKKKSEYNHLFSHCNATGQLNPRCQRWMRVHRAWRRTTILCSSILALRNCIFTHSSSLSLYLYLGLWRKSHFTENKPQS